MELCPVVIPLLKNRPYQSILVATIAAVYGYRNLYSPGLAQSFLRSVSPEARPVSFPVGTTLNGNYRSEAGGNSAMSSRHNKLFRKAP